MTPSKAKPKSKSKSRASKPRKSVAKSKSRSKSKSKSSPKAGAKAKLDVKAQRATGKMASRLIDQRIQSLGDWRAETLTEVRRTIQAADPDIVEEWKWMGTPVWSHAGNVCTGETYKQVVKLTFARGASLKDPQGLFNSSL